jgi:hypothetical protein
MCMLTTVGQTMQRVLTIDAEQAARDSRFGRRRSKLGGATCTQALVFGCLAHAEPTLEQWAQMAAACGQPVQPQAFDQRFGPEAADCLQRVLARAIDQVVAQEPTAGSLLARFTGV